MPVSEVLARQTTFELNTGTEAVPVWVLVGHTNKFDHSPKANDADTTTFDDEGRMTHLKASRGDEFTVAGLRQEDEITGDRDAAQEACEAWANEIGQSSLKQFRITSPGGNLVGPFWASATVKQMGGGNDDPNAWELSIVVSGALNP